MAIYPSDSGVRILYNEATVSGGGIHGCISAQGYQVLYNRAPRGAGISVLRESDAITGSDLGALCYNAHIYNPLLDGRRQNEIYINETSHIAINGCWFGSNDTTGLISGTKTEPWTIYASEGHAVSHWLFNKGAAPAKVDTLLPVHTWFTYANGKPLPKKAHPWMRGTSYTASSGRFLDSTPHISADDTLRGMYQSYVYPKGDTGSKSVNITCVIDADTFRATRAIWGRDSLYLSMATYELPEVFVYPNPAQEQLHLSGASAGMRYTLSDLSGKCVGSGVLGSELYIAVGSYPRGLYILGLYDEAGNTATAKVVLE